MDPQPKPKKKRKAILRAEVDGKTWIFHVDRQRKVIACRMKRTKPIYLISPEDLVDLVSGQKRISLLECASRSSPPNSPGESPKPSIESFGKETSNRKRTRSPEESLATVCTPEAGDCTPGTDHTLAFDCAKEFEALAVDGPMRSEQIPGELESLKPASRPSGPGATAQSILSQIVDASPWKP